MLELTVAGLRLCRDGEETFPALELVHSTSPGAGEQGNIIAAIRDKIGRSSPQRCL